MSKLLPSKTSNVVNVMVSYLKSMSNSGMRNRMEFCRAQSSVFRNADIGSDEYNTAISLIFTMCKQMKIAPIFPPLFFTCLCSAIDITTSKESKNPILFGLTVFA
jgi:hypothetical protein